MNVLSVGPLCSSVFTVKLGTVCVPAVATKATGDQSRDYLSVYFPVFCFILFIIFESHNSFLIQNVSYMSYMEN